MRIIAGKLGGRQFDSPKAHATHPMSDKMRGAMFNALGELDGLRVLDAFTGSGALGFEAISRGASYVLAIELDRQAQTVIASNAKNLSLSNYRLIKASAGGWSDNNPEEFFNIVLLDPPYDKLQTTVLQKLTDHLVPQGILVLSWPGKQPLPEFEGLTVVNQKVHGDAQLAFYRLLP